MAKYNIYSTRSDYQTRYSELKEMENTFKSAQLKWDKIKKANLDDLDVIISTIKRQIKSGAIETKIVINI